MVMTYDFSQDCAPEIVPTDEALGTINKITIKLLIARETVAELTTKLKEAKDNLRNIEEMELPEAMSVVGFSEGDKISVQGVELGLKNVMQMSMSGENSKYREPVVAWLRETQNDGLIKNQFKIDLPKGQIDSDGLSSLKKFLKDMGFAYTQYEDVNTSSVKALMRSMVDEGKNVPVEKLGARVFVKATVKLGG